MEQSTPTWFESEPSVFEDEKLGLEALGFVLDAAKLATDRAVVFSGRSQQDPKRELRIIYPSGFPSFPPDIVDDGGQPLLARHQHPNRAFCLFGPDRVRWLSWMKGTDAVAEAESLIRDYPPGATTPLELEVPEPVSDLLPTQSFGGFLVPPEIVAWASRITHPSLGECQFRLSTGNTGDIKRGVISSAKIRGTSATADGIYGTLLNGQVITATFIRLQATPPLFSEKEGPSVWFNSLPKELRLDPKTRWIVVCYPEESRSTRHLDLAFTVLHVQGGKFECFKGFALDPDQRFSRIPGLESLPAKRVVVLGVGSLGSRIATCLAASGVGSFHLVDHDVFEPANAVRHECGVTSFGLPKCRAVAHRLKQTNPHMECTGAIARIGSLALSEEQDLLERIQNADLVVDATGSELAGHWIHRRCQMLKKACLHAAVANGAWSGEVIRVLPGETPCWVCHQVSDEPGPAEPKPPGGYFAAGCAHPTFTGTMPEVSIVADLAAAMAIETMLRRTGMDFGGSHIRWAARNTEGRWAPQIKVHTPVARQECACCPPSLKQ
jgi:molybdopterin/thiamine biosynthesis adenylyltransferase